MKWLLIIFVAFSSQFGMTNYGNDATSVYTRTNDSVPPYSAAAIGVTNICLQKIIKNTDSNSICWGKLIKRFRFNQVKHAKSFLSEYCNMWNTRNETSNDCSIYENI